MTKEQCDAVLLKMLSRISYAEFDCNIMQQHGSSITIRCAVVPSDVPAILQALGIATGKQAT